MRTFISTVCLLVLLFIGSPMVSAATVSFRPTPALVGAGDTVRVDVLLTSAVAVNAFSGTVSYSPDTLAPVEIIDGDSIINAWITRPTFSPADARIRFAGITPGGFFGSDKILFSILFQATREGAAVVMLGAVEVLRNDGIGTEEPTQSKPLSFAVASEPLRSYAEPRDDDPPEPFAVYVDTDPELSGGKWYLAFSAVDKGSGIRHYAIAESRLPPLLFSLFPHDWDQLMSGPYELRDQRRLSTVYIKAVDRAGNERVVTFPPEQLLTPYEEAVLLGILIVLALLGWTRRGKRPHNHA